MGIQVSSYFIKMQTAAVHWSYRPPFFVVPSALQTIKTAATDLPTLSIDWDLCCKLAYIDDNNNKSAQSNLGRGPRRGVVPHVRRKVPIGYNGAPQIRPPNNSSRGPIPKFHYLPHPWTRPTYDAKRHPDPIRRFCTMHWTDRRTHVRTYRPTDRKRESLTTIGRCATRATRPNNCEAVSRQHTSARHIICKQQYAGCESVKCRLK